MAGRPSAQGGRGRTQPDGRRPGQPVRRVGRTVRPSSVGRQRGVDVPGREVASYGAPTVKDGVVYAVEDSRRAGHWWPSTRATGELLWREKNPCGSGNELEVAPTVDDHFVYKHCAAGHPRDRPPQPCDGLAPRGASGQVQRPAGAGAADRRRGERPDRPAAGRPVGPPSASSSRPYLITPRRAAHTMQPLGHRRPDPAGAVPPHGCARGGRHGQGVLGIMTVPAGPRPSRCCVPSSRTTGNLAQRFLREAQTAQAVSSNGIGRSSGSQTEGGRPWIATEYLSGPTLEQAVAGHGPLDEAGVRALAAALASTLREIHAAGLIHRDLKPANIVLTSSGPRVIDFGIARPEHGLTLTTTGQAPVDPRIRGTRADPRSARRPVGRRVLPRGGPGVRGERQAGVRGCACRGGAVRGGARQSRAPRRAGRAPPLIAPCLAKDPAHRPQPSSVIQLSAPPRGADRLWKKGVLGTQIKEHETRTSRLSTLAGTTVRGVRSRQAALPHLARRRRSGARSGRRRDGLVAEQRARSARSRGRRAGGAAGRR